MSNSYHDFLESAYFGRYVAFDRRSGNYTKPGLQYRADPGGMASLTAKSSYHFSHALTLALAGNPNVFGPVDLNQLLKNPPASAHADLPEGDRLSELVNDHLDKLGLDNVALIFEGPPGGSTIAIITCFEWFTTNYLVAVKPDNGGWMMLDGQQITAASNAFMGMAERALSMLANPAVEYIMRQPSSGMSFRNLMAWAISCGEIALLGSLGFSSARILVS